MLLWVKRTSPGHESWRATLHTRSNGFPLTYRAEIVYRTEVEDLENVGPQSFHTVITVTDRFKRETRHSLISTLNPANARALAEAKIAAMVEARYHP